MFVYIEYISDDFVETGFEKAFLLYNEQFSDVSYWEIKYITKKRKLLYHALNLCEKKILFFFNPLD